MRGDWNRALAVAGAHPHHSLGSFHAVRGRAVTEGAQREQLASGRSASLNVALSAASAKRREAEAHERSGEASRRRVHDVRETAVAELDGARGAHVPVVAGAPILFADPMRRTALAAPERPVRINLAGLPGEADVADALVGRV